jgi:hypothetical protein
MPTIDEYDLRTFSHSFITQTRNYLISTERRPAARVTRALPIQPGGRKDRCSLN